MVPRVQPSANAEHDDAEDVKRLLQDGEASLPLDLLPLLYDSHFMNATVISEAKNTYDAKLQMTMVQTPPNPFMMLSKYVWTLLSVDQTCWT